LPSPNQEITIDPIREEHIEGYHRCLDQVARERRFLGSTQAPPLESSRQFVLANIALDSPQYVAVAGSTVVGWIDVLPRKSEPFRHCGVLGMGVSKEYRGIGIGKRLMDAALAHVKRIGLERVELEVYSSNLPAIRLYEGYGFKREGVKVRACKLDGVYDDVVEMALFV
jgi:ribosomal protein S18 acetylase RimI-like enzyme